MDALQVVSMVSGVISILAFVFAVWVWLRSDIKVRELTGVVQTVFDMSGSILWEMQTQDAEDTETRWPVSCA